MGLIHLPLWGWVAISVSFGLYLLWTDVPTSFAPVVLGTSVIGGVGGWLFMRLFARPGDDRLKDR